MFYARQRCAAARHVHCCLPIQPLSATSRYAIARYARDGYVRLRYVAAAASRRHTLDMPSRYA